MSGFKLCSKLVHHLQLPNSILNSPQQPPKGIYTRKKIIMSNMECKKSISKLANE